MQYYIFLMKSCAKLVWWLLFLGEGGVHSLCHIYLSKHSIITNHLMERMNEYTKLPVYAIYIRARHRKQSVTITIYLLYVCCNAGSHHLLFQTETSEFSNRTVLVERNVKSSFVLEPSNKCVYCEQ